MSAGCDMGCKRSTAKSSDEQLDPAGIVSGDPINPFSIEPLHR